MKKKANGITKKEIIPVRKVEQLVKIEAQYKALKAVRDLLKEDILTSMQEVDLESFKTGSYTLTRAKRITPLVRDVRMLKKSLDYARIPYETEETFKPFMQATFRRLLEEKKDMLGLEKQETEYVLIRIKEEEN